MEFTPNRKPTVLMRRINDVWDALDYIQSGWEAKPKTGLSRHNLSAIWKTIFRKLGNQLRPSY